MLGFWLQDITNWVYRIYSQVSVICFKNFLMMFSNFILRWYQCEDINKARYDTEVLSAPWEAISKFFLKNKEENSVLEIYLQLVILWMSLLKVSCWHIWTLDPGKSSSYLLRSQVTDASNQLANNLCNFPEFLCYHFAFLLLCLGTVSFCMGDQTKDP